MNKSLAPYRWTPDEVVQGMQVQREDRGKTQVIQLGFNILTSAYCIIHLDDWTILDIVYSKPAVAAWLTNSWFMPLTQPVATTTPEPL